MRRKNKDIQACYLKTRGVEEELPHEAASHNFNETNQHKNPARRKWMPAEQRRAKTTACREQLAEDEGGSHDC